MVGSTVDLVKPQHLVYRPDERSHVVVMVDGTWHEGELRMWSQTADGSWQGKRAVAAHTVSHASAAYVHAAVLFSCGSPRIVEGFSMRLPGRGPRCSRS